MLKNAQNVKYLLKKMKDVIILLVGIANINGVGYVKVNIIMSIIPVGNAKDINLLEQII